ncbi:IMD-like protein, partial [Apostichopus japonicus]
KYLLKWLPLQGTFCTFVLNIKEGTQERHKCTCYFKAGQESELVELLFILKDGEEDSAASSSNKVVDAGISQSQKKTGDESQTVQQPLEHIDLEVRTESLKEIKLHLKPRRSKVTLEKMCLFWEETSKKEMFGFDARFGYQRYKLKWLKDKCCFVTVVRSLNECVSNPSLPSHQATRGEAEGNPAGAEAMEKDSEVVKDSTLWDLSGKFSKEWRDVGRNLKLDETELDNIEADNKIKGQKEVVYQMLLLWKRKHGMKATNKTLRDALIAANRKDLSYWLQMTVEDICPISSQTILVVGRK